MTYHPLPSLLVFCVMLLRVLTLSILIVVGANHRRYWSIGVLLRKPCLGCWPIWVECCRVSPDVVHANGLSVHSKGDSRFLSFELWVGTDDDVAVIDPRENFVAANLNRHVVPLACLEIESGRI